MRATSFGACSPPSTPSRLIFETAAETGAPFAETLGIVWREVDLDAETITFSHQLESHGARIPLKAKRSRRTIEVAPSLIAKLREHKLASGPHTSCS